MKDFNTILSEFGIEVPEDKKEGLRKAVAENYKTVAEYGKKVDALEKAENEAKTAKEAIAKFEGLDPEKIKDEIEGYKQQVKDAEEKYRKDTEARLFTDAAEKLLGGYTFSSNAAKMYALSELKASGLKLVDGAIMGGEDFMTKLQEKDEKICVPVDAPQFTMPRGKDSGKGGKLTREQIADIKDDDARLKAIADNQDLFA